MNYSINPDLAISGTATRNAELRGGIDLSTHYVIEARDPQGNLKWVDEFDNLVTTAGLNVSLTQTFLSASAAPDWHVGVTTGSPVFAASDTMAGHAGWTESALYDESLLQTLTLGSVSNGSVSNTASKAVFTISANATPIGGAFVTTASAKGATTGTLYGGGAFVAGTKTLDDGDSLSVTCTLTATAA
jgi:hypothetical protein